jgi:hypothetical protein
MWFSRLAGGGERRRSCTTFVGFDFFSPRKISPQIDFFTRLDYGVTRAMPCTSATYLFPRLVPRVLHKVGGVILLFPEEVHMLDSSSLSQSGTTKRVALVAVIAALGGGLGFYGLHEHRAAQNAAASSAQASAELSSTKQQVSDLTSKVNELVARSEAQQAPAAPQAQGPSGAKPGAARKPKDDPRFKKLQSQIDAQNEAIEKTRNDLASTQGDLSSTRTELSGNIAHTHDELVLLERKGERSYAEFDITKSKQFAREGPFEIRLRKADNRHQFADLDLLVDDRNLTQKHVNIYQPVMFSTPDSPQPVEVVINNISKDHIHGYVSASKYRQSELSSMSNGAGTDAGPVQTASDEQTAPRQKLPKPQ